MEREGNGMEQGRGREKGEGEGRGREGGGRRGRERRGEEDRDGKKEGEGNAVVARMLTSNVSAVLRDARKRRHLSIHISASNRRWRREFFKASLRLIRLDEGAQSHRTSDNGRAPRRVVSHHETQTSACPAIRRTFHNLWCPPTRSTRSVESRCLKSNPSMYRTAGHFPFGVVAIHLGSFVHVPLRLQLCHATQDV